MSDLEDILRRDLRLVDDALATPPAPVDEVLARGHAGRRHRRRVRAGAGIGTGLALAGVLVATTPWQLLRGQQSSPQPAVSAALTNVRQATTVEAANRLNAVQPVAGKEVSIAGTPYLAWSWTDARGENVLLATRQIDERLEGGIILNAVLRVFHGSGLGTPQAKVTQSVTADNGEPLTATTTGPCTVDGGINFVDGSTQVGDANRDGLGEATIGWWKLCTGDASPASVNLAMITDHRVYRLTGEGSPRRVRPAEKYIFPTPLSAPIPPSPSALTLTPTSVDKLPVAVTAEPKQSAWPAGTFASASALFRTLYR